VFYTTGLRPFYVKEPRQSLRAGSRASGGQVRIIGISDFCSVCVV